jgi:glutaredoxin-related protein
VKELLSKNNINYIEMDITKNLLFLKMFLKFRDNRSEFDSVKEKGSIGLPCIVVNDGEEIILNFENLDIEGLK